MFWLYGFFVQTRIFKIYIRGGTEKKVGEICKLQSSRLYS